MFSKPLAVLLLLIACVMAAAGSAFVAVKRHAPSTAAAGPDAPAIPSSPAVQESEGLVAVAPASTRRAELGPVEEPAGSTEALVAAPSSAARVAVTTVRPGKVVVEKPLRREPRETTASTLSASRPAAARSDSRPSATRSASRSADKPAVPFSGPEPAATPRTEPVMPAEPAPADPVRVEPPPPPPAEFVELVIPSASVIGLQIETPVSTERANLEDRVDARVLRDVAVDGRTAIPAGTRALGAVTLVERGGKVKERARLGVRFHSLVLADGTQLPIRTDTILREGDSPTGESAAKIGGAAVGGAILGALMGGKKGAIVGGATGAAGGTAVVMSGGRNAAALPVGAIVTVRLSTPVSIEVERR